MSRSDVASFNVNLTLPPEIIKEYFTGLASVESAKAHDSNGFDDLIKFVSPMIPGLMSFVVNSPGVFDEKTSQVKKSTSKKRERSLEAGFNFFDEKDCVDIQKDVDNVVTTYVVKVSNDSNVSKVFDVLMKKLEDDFINKKSSSDDSAKEDEESSKVDEEKSDDGKDKAEEDKVEEESKHKAHQVFNRRRGVYQEGDEGVVGLNAGVIDLNSAFGQNGGNLNDMMKMLGPMMENIMGGFSNMNLPKPPEETTTTTSTSPTVAGKGEEIDGGELDKLD